MLDDKKNEPRESMNGNLKLIIIACIISLSLMALVVLGVYFLLSTTEGEISGLAALSSACFAGLALIGVTYSIITQTLDAAKNRQLQRLTVLSLFVRSLPRRIDHLKNHDKEDEAKQYREALDTIFTELSKNIKQSLVGT